MKKCNIVDFPGFDLQVYNILQLAKKTEIAAQVLEDPIFCPGY